MNETAQTIVNYYMKYGDNPKKFFSSLCRAMIEEYSSAGRCEYSEAIIYGRASFITNVERAVTYELLRYYLSRSTLTDPAGADCIPHLVGDSARWCYGMNTVCTNDEDIERIKCIDHAARQLYIDRNCSDAAAVPTSLPADTSRTVDALQKKANLLRIIRKKHADENAFATQLIAEARTAADEIVANARVSADRIVANARQTANQIEANTNARCVEELEVARANAAQIHAKADEKAEALIAQYLDKYQQDIQNEWVFNVAGEQDRASYDYLQSARQEMCKYSDTLMRTLRDHNIQMKQMQENMDHTLRNYQSAIYRQEQHRFCEAYCQLYRIIYNNAVLTEAVLSDSDSERAEAADTARSVSSIVKLKASLITLLKNMETALNKMGLFVYRPAENEEFDDVWFSPCGEQPVGNGKLVVARCITPGMAYCPREDDEGDPVIRAVVELKRLN